LHEDKTVTLHGHSYGSDLKGSFELSGVILGHRDVVLDLDAVSLDPLFALISHKALVGVSFLERDAFLDGIFERGLEGTSKAALVTHLFGAVDKLLLRKVKKISSLLEIACLNKPSDSKSPISSTNVLVLHRGDSTLLDPVDLLGTRRLEVTLLEELLLIGSQSEAL
jgi:hypothetical protein